MSRNGARRCKWLWKCDHCDYYWTRLAIQCTYSLVRACVRALFNPLFFLVYISFSSTLLFSIVFELLVSIQAHSTRKRLGLSEEKKNVGYCLCHSLTSSFFSHSSPFIVIFFLLLLKLCVSVAADHIRSIHYATIGEHVDEKRSWCAGQSTRRRGVEEWAEWREGKKCSLMFHAE